MLSAETVERLAGHQVCAAVSGGKDSTAMSLWLTEQGISHSRVFADTGCMRWGLCEHLPADTDKSKDDR